MADRSLKGVTDGHGGREADPVAAVGADDPPLDVDVRDKILLAAPSARADLPVPGDNPAVSPMLKNRPELEVLGGRALRVLREPAPGDPFHPLGLQDQDRFDSLNIALPGELSPAEAARPLNLPKCLSVLRQCVQDHSGLPGERRRREPEAAEPVDDREVAASLLVRDRLDTVLAEDPAEDFLAGRKEHVDDSFAA